MLATDYPRRESRRDGEGSRCSGAASREMRTWQLDDTIDVPRSARRPRGEGTLRSAEAAELIYAGRRAVVTLASLKALGGRAVAAKYRIARSVFNALDRPGALRSYLRPPTRWLLSGSKRLSDGSSAHAVMIETLARSQYDGAWQSIDECALFDPLSSGSIRSTRSVDASPASLARIVMRQPSDAMPSFSIRRSLAARLERKAHGVLDATVRSWRCWLDAKGRKLPIEDQLLRRERRAPV